MNAEEIREEVRRLLDIESKTVELDKKQKLALLAFMLAQQAEALAHAQPTEPSSVERAAVADSNIQRFVEQLYSEKNATQRKLYQHLMLSEERCYGIKEERLERLQRLVCDCDRRVERFRELLGRKRDDGAATDGNQMLDTLLEAQQFLRASLKRELDWQNQAF